MTSPTSSWARSSWQSRALPHGHLLDDLLRAHPRPLPGIPTTEDPSPTARALSPRRSGPQPRDPLHPDRRSPPFAREGSSPERGRELVVRRDGADGVSWRSRQQRSSSSPLDPVGFGSSIRPALLGAVEALVGTRVPREDGRGRPETSAHTRSVVGRPARHDPGDASPTARAPAPRNAGPRRRNPPPERGVPCGADDGIRTRDPHLGKVMLYQLSHVRVGWVSVAKRVAWSNPARPPVRPARCAPGPVGPSPVRERCRRSPRW